ncbi:putative amino acid permease YhdG [Sedimentisphaera cyanobacteriorum]|uniref:Putative amino acid permease YhdG n=1 Tax=Sedimentisphaera cyanobacteriorum TaxID=1940790 RepID=A0A1Q2HQL8_9BACT|nr:amino acid permease [Sedimentisphaera cyanobacteriorum]AQQ09747.1 putative amino acid permease YhdG [Sedimentisphaera cyanobacteriorum]
MPKLERSLSMLDVFCLSSGAMISSGLFVLPAIAYSQAGPAAVLSYIFASLLIVPGLLSKVELATAMPRSGGTYFYVQRSLGSLWGIFTGLANWFSLALKSAFAIIGIIALVEVAASMIDLQLTPLQMKIAGAGCCLFFTFLNIISVKSTTRFQIVLVAGLLITLTLYITVGFNSVKVSRFENFMPHKWSSVFATAGLVFISFGGLTKVANIAEEVRNPARNLTLGMILAWLIVSLFYLLTIIVTIGVLEPEELKSSYAPIALAAKAFMSNPGFILLSIAALTAYITTANGGLLAASRAPLAMSRDKLLPAVLGRVGKTQTPYVSIIITSLIMIAAIATLEIEILVKTASTLMIVLFILDNASVIIMRESRIQSYRPEFRTPLYPYLNIIAIILYCLLIIDMGFVPLAISAGFFLLSILWYLLFTRHRVQSYSAVMRIVERVSDKQLKTSTLENELREILLERDNIVEDRFDRLIRNCEIIDIPDSPPPETLFSQIASSMAEKVGADRTQLYEKFIQREKQSATIVEPGLAIPHIVVDGREVFCVSVIRAKQGIKFPSSDEPVKIIFALAGSADQRNFHLRALMAIAQTLQQKKFVESSLAARTTEDIRSLILLSSRKRDAN